MISISALVKVANVIETNEGNVSYKIPHCFQVSPDGEDIVFHGTMPEDLSEFICQAAMGQPNPQIKRPKE